jgi:hypothetical protein
MVPPTHGAWLAAAIPGTEAHLDPEQGHLSIAVAEVPGIQAWLAGHLD